MRTAFIQAAAISAIAVATVAGAQGLIGRNYNVGNFDRIEVAGPYNVEVRTGDRVSVAGRGTTELMQRTIVEVKDGELSIHPRRENRWWGRNWSRNEKANFVVTVPQLRGATIAGSGSIKVDRVRGPRFEGQIGGSGSLQVGSIDVQQVEFGIGGSGSVRALGGRAQRAEYNIGGSGDINAAAIAVQNAKVSIAGSGDVAARASGTADVSIVGSGDVAITGGAKCNISKMGSGRVRCS